jgi:hypothetical protein
MYTYKVVLKRSPGVPNDYDDWEIVSCHNDYWCAVEEFKSLESPYWVAVGSDEAWRGIMRYEGDKCAGIRTELSTIEFGD